MKARTRLALEVVGAFVGALALGTVVGMVLVSAKPAHSAPLVATYTAPAGVPHDAAAVKEFCRQFTDDVSNVAIAASTTGVPRTALTVYNGPDYVVDALNVLIDALYAGDYGAAVQPYHAAVAACVKYKTTTSA